MLNLNNVSAVSAEQELLTNITLTVNANELITILGPVDSGKSSLAQLIAGYPRIIQTEGKITFNKKNIDKLDAQERNKLGIFVSFQNPPSIDGISNLDLVKQTLKNANDTRTSNEIEHEYKSFSVLLGLGINHKSKSINGIGSTPSEHKKNELLQMLMQSPQLAILDGIDDDLDVDDENIVAAVINSYSKQPNKACILLTNNLVFLDKIKSTTMYILIDGIIKTHGDAQLHKRIVDDDYTQFL